MIQINSTYNEDHIKERLQVFVERFYESMTTKLEGMTLKNITDKNPYLLRVKGFNTASDIVNSALNAYVSSAEETVFGNEVFEPLAKEVCNGNKALAEGVDVMIERDREIFAIAVKSGPRVFNADSKKRQIQNFEKAKKLAQQARKAYYPVIGYCYGRKDTEGHAYEMAGQVMKNFTRVFWNGWRFPPLSETAIKARLIEHQIAWYLNLLLNIAIRQAR